MMRKGFTLVELSIVLVIIGLLIGGILAAQSMVDTSKVAATGKQLGEFDVAVSNFATRFNGQIPGDSRFFSATSGGDGDGSIESFATWGGGVFQNYLTAYQCEIANFWSQAMPDQYVSSGTCGAVATIAVEGANKTNPKPAIGIKNTIFMGSTVTTFPLNQNYYSITLSTANSTTGGHFRLIPSSSTNKVLKPIELSALDNKFDDGFANSGNIRSGSYLSPWGDPSLTATGTCSSGANYFVSTATYECSPFFRFGTISGDLK